MKRTILLLSISVLATLILGWVNLAEGQQKGKVYRIGFLGGLPFPARREAFRQGLRELGYVEGKNIAIEWRYTERKLYSAVLAELVRLKVDVIVTAGPTPTRVAKEATMMSTFRRTNTNSR